MSKNKKVIFIDRDGVINKDPGGWTKHSYVTEWKDFYFIAGSKEAIKKLNKNGYDIVVISNQGGVSKGFFREKELSNINQKMLDEINKSGGRVKKVYYCIHKDSDNCDCRKPKIGLFRKAEKELKIKVINTYFIGDGKSDIEAGEKMHLKTILVLSGKIDLQELRTWDIKPDYIFDDLKEAADFIISKGVKE